MREPPSSRGADYVGRAAERVFLLGLAMFFVVAPWIIGLAIRPGSYALSEILAATTIGAIPTAYAAVRVLCRSSEASRAYFSSAVPLALALLFTVVTLALFSLPTLDDLRISREYERVETLPMRLLNLHLVVTFLASSWFFDRSTRSLGSFAALVVAIVLSLFISFAEGRRTAAVLPLGIAGLFWIADAKLISSAVMRGLSVAAASAAVFASVTAVRIASSVEFSVAAPAIASRVFNTGATALEVFDSGDRSFDPALGSQSAHRIAYVLGMGDYTSRTNEFGVHYGFLPPSNAVVGINPGVVVEAFLALKTAYILLLIVIIEVALWLLRAFRELIFGADLLVALLLVHGFQMEVPYTVGLEFRLVLAALALLGLRRLLLMAERNLEPQH